MIRDRARPKTVADLRKNQDFKKAVQEEIQDFVGSNFQQIILSNPRVPVAAIDIRVNGSPIKSQRQITPNGYLINPHQSSNNSTMNSIGDNVKVNVEIENMNDSVNYDEYSQRLDQTNKGTNNYVCWSEETPKNTSQMSRNVNSNYHHGCKSPFGNSVVKRPGTSFQGPRISSRPFRSMSTDNFVQTNTDPDHQYVRSSRSRQYSRGVNRAVDASKFTNSVAVGPDKHFSETSTNTRDSYQLSDYLKKSMNLNDPYERKVFSCLMEIMRIKNKPRPDSANQSEQDDDLNSIAGPSDPIIQISEYKSNYRNPNYRSASLPTASNENWRSNTATKRVCPAATRLLSSNVVIKKPLCTHKTPFKNLVMRPSTNATSKFRHGEQFLY